VSDPIILRLAEDRFWLSTSDCDLELWAKGVAVHSPFDFSIRDANVSVIQIQGPKSPRLMANIFGDAILDLKNYWSMRTEFEGHDLRVSRTGWSGEFGYEIYLENAAQGDALFDALMDAGRTSNVAPGAVNQARRIESGILSWGGDMTPAESPFDVGLGRLVELADTPDFVGRSALVRLRDSRPRKVLVGLTVAGAPLDPNEELWPITTVGAPAGSLTSLAYSPRLDCNIALALVAPQVSQPGNPLDVETWNGKRLATVTEIPFVPKRQRGSARALCAGTAA